LWSFRGMRSAFGDQETKEKARTLAEQRMAVPQRALQDLKKERAGWGPGPTLPSDNRLPVAAKTLWSKRGAGTGASATDYQGPLRGKPPLAFLSLCSASRPNQLPDLGERLRSVTGDLRNHRISEAQPGAFPQRESNPSKRPRPIPECDRFRGRRHPLDRGRGA